MFSMSLPSCVIAATLCTVQLIHPLLCGHSPVPTITWRKINGNIPKKARLRKSQAVLEIPNIQLEDSGTYECKAENPRGGTAFKGHLQVYSESEHALNYSCFISHCVCVHLSHSQVENSSIVLWFLFLERTLLLSVWSGRADSLHTFEWVQRSVQEWRWVRVPQ